MEQVGGYGALKARLSQEPAPVVDLSLSEIEAIMGRSLPPSARGQVMRQWWANTRTHSQARAWLDAGRKAKVDVRGGRVAFVRSEPAPKEAPVQGDDIVVPQEALSWRADRLLRQTAAEKGLDLGAAAAALLDELSTERLRKKLDWFEGRSGGGGPSSVELIREDRDSR